MWELEEPLNHVTQSNYSSDTAQSFSIYSIPMGTEGPQGAGRVVHLLSQFKGFCTYTCISSYMWSWEKLCPDGKEDICILRIMKVKQGIKWLDQDYMVSLHKYGTLNSKLLPPFLLLVILSALRVQWYSISPKKGPVRVWACENMANNLTLKLLITFQANWTHLLIS